MLRHVAQEERHASTAGIREPLLRKGAIMKSRTRSLTTMAAAASIVSLSVIAWSQAVPDGIQTATRAAIPNAESHRFIPSPQVVDPETSTPAKGSTATADAVSAEPPSFGFFTEAPA